MSAAFSLPFSSPSSFSLQSNEADSPRLAKEKSQSRMMVVVLVSNPRYEANVLKAKARPNCRQVEMKVETAEIWTQKE
jgi:hypothetical protein